MIPLKRRKVSLPVEQQIDSCTFPHVSIFILERKMGTSRRAFLTRLGRSKGFLIKETYRYEPSALYYGHYHSTVFVGVQLLGYSCLFYSHSSSITHVVSENNSGDEVQAWAGQPNWTRCLQFCPFVGHQVVYGEHGGWTSCL